MYYRSWTADRNATGQLADATAYAPHGRCVYNTQRYRWTDGSILLFCM